MKRTSDIMVPEFIILMAKEGLNGGISKKQTLLAAKIMIIEWFG